MQIFKYVNVKSELDYGSLRSILLTRDEFIQSETVLIQRIYTHFKKAPATHKLGVLYVVDSVTRAWVEQARKKGQNIGSSATDGTFAAGVNRVTELLPAFMNDLINTAPEEQKVRFQESSLRGVVQFVDSLMACTSLGRLTHFVSRKSPLPCMFVIWNSRISLELRSGSESSLTYGSVEILFQPSCFRMSSRD